MSEASAGTRVAIVTGAARGIGAATALRLAQDGFAVAVLDLEEAAGKDTVQAIEAAGGRALAVGADVSDADQVQAAVDRVAAELGAPTVLINNAGVTRDNMLFKMTETDWDVVMNVHLRGAFLMTRAVQKHMIEAKWGRIVSLSSTSALGNRGQANYSAAKAGIVGLTKTVAKEWGQFKINVNAVAFGFVETRLTASKESSNTMEIDGQTIQLGIPDQLRGMAPMLIPLGRGASPQEAAGPVFFLCSPWSNYVHGQTLMVTGGAFGGMGS
jgi:3-oxoacyl-[acyl-carrier protein] reductase